LVPNSCLKLIVVFTRKHTHETEGQYRKLCVVDWANEVFSGSISLDNRHGHTVAKLLAGVRKNKNAARESKLKFIIILYDSVIKQKPY